MDRIDLIGNELGPALTKEDRPSDLLGSVLSGFNGIPESLKAWAEVPQHIVAAEVACSG